MAWRIDFLFAQPHVIDPVTAVFVVIIHHIAQETMKVVEASFCRRVGFLQSQMPFSDVTGGIPGAIEQIWKIRPELKPCIPERIQNCFLVVAWIRVGRIGIWIAPHTMSVWIPPGNN